MLCEETQHCQVRSFDNNLENILVCHFLPRSSQELLNLDLDVKVAGDVSSPSSSVTPTSSNKRGSLTKISPVSVPNFKTLLMKSEVGGKDEKYVHVQKVHIMAQLFSFR